MKHWFSDVAAFQRDPLALMLERGASAQEPLVPMALGHRPVFLVADPELVKPILKMDESIIDKGRLTHKLRSIVGISSLTLSGEEHNRRREAVHPHMARGQVERLAPEMAAEIRRAAIRLAIIGRFEVHDFTAALSLKLISLALFGHQILTAADEQVMVEAVRSVEDDLASEMFRVLPPAPWTARARRRQRDFARLAMGLVVERTRARVPDTSVFRALEDLGLGKAELRDEIMTMLIAGHHTTGTASAWLLYYLAKDERLAESIAAEARGICGRDGDLRPERLKDAPISQGLVREVLRLYPSAWWFSREVRRSIELGGRQLKPGTSLLICPWQMHRDPRFWEAPDEFRLDRNYKGKAYIPFGAGPRTCIGMGVSLLQLQVLALEIASAFEFALVGDGPLGQPKPSITLIPPRMEMTIRPRDLPKQASVAA